jgi:hypothetical protein
MFSLAPLGVALAFFLVFMWPLDIPNRDTVIAIGIAAGFIGLESYWVFRGWQKNHIITILLGIIGIAITVAMVWLYVTFG